jgi:serine/threonine protein kinase
MGSKEKDRASSPDAQLPKQNATEDNGKNGLEQPPQAADSPTELAAADAVGVISEKAWLGRVIDDRYRITNLIGRGGMGAVFEAEHLKLHKRVAFKVVRAELAGNGEVAVRFAREAMATAQFEHPHVASALDFGTLPEGGAYFVMQLVRGKSLAELVDEKQGLPWPKVCELAAQVADALSAAESAGIVHRDLKPENILIEAREDGSELARILDFGIAHVPQSEATCVEGAMSTRKLTRVGTIIGTPGYMAPEQAMGEVVDHRADLYALGVVLWESIAGRSLWDEPNLAAILSRQIEGPAPSLMTVATGKAVPPALNTLVDQLLRFKREERPAHAAQVRDTLRSIARDGDAAGGEHRGWFTKKSKAFGDRLRGCAAQWRKQSLVHRKIQVIAVWVSALSLGFGIYALMTRGAGSSGSKIGQLWTSMRSVELKVLERGIPKELEEPVDTMLHASRRTDRRTAARKVLEYRPADRVMQYILDIAALETARGCQELEKAVLALDKARDIRTLPTLQRFSDMPRTGCGFLNLEDCYRCVRKELKAAIGAIVELEPGSAKTP